ncbi:MAG: hypothetical protein SVS85_01790 [Candidatus Nanohaloarchaea archaeon]|nr:hypothetical protein [Candidatus Nanohaloarchaea archaeon]
MRETGSRKPRVSQRCDVCKEERLSVLEGDRYICEVCLDGEPEPEAAVPAKI